MSERVRQLLRRPDKWFLGGGKAALWAPEFPLYLDQPGFWDPAMWLNHQTGAIYAITILDENGRAMPSRFEGRSWTPSDMTLQFTLGGSNYDALGFYAGRPGGAVSLTEEKALLPTDVLVDRLTFTSPQARELTVVVWTAQEQPGKVRRLHEVSPSRWVWAWHEGEEQPKLWGALALGADRDPVAQGVRYAQGFPGGAHPRWEYTPFFEVGVSNGETPPESGSGWAYGALAYKVRVPAGGRATLTLFAALAGAPAGRAPSASDELALPAASAAAEATDAAVSALGAARRLEDPIEASRSNWDAFFRTVPDFRCDDPQIEQYYWYRYYGLRLNAIYVRDADLRLPHACVFEGINPGWFRQHITYSAQVHMRELGWLRDSELAEGSLLNFIAEQKEDGSFHGAIRDSGSDRGRGFYFGNWGRSVRELWRLHGNEEFLEKVYGPLVRYANWLERERGPVLTSVVNHWETGQEYMSRYTAVDRAADQGGPFNGLKGIDASVYTYELMRTLGWMARRLALPTAEKWEARADAVRQAIKDLLWHGSYFTDYDENRGQRTGVKAAVGFYPFFTDIAEPEHLVAITEHLLNPAEFDTAYPWPATALEDETADTNGYWKGRRMACPWNGRSWLMTNGHILEALCEAAVRLQPDLRAVAAERLRRAIQMLFVDGLPTSFEYYHPLTGQPPYFRATEDYMHSHLADLILRYGAGLRPNDEALVIDPLPLLRSYRIDGLKIRGKEIGILYDQADGIEVSVGGRTVASAPHGPVRIPL